MRSERGDTMIWLVLLGLVAAALIGGTIYMTAAVGRFGLISSIDQKWLKIVVSLGIIALAFTAVTLIMSLVNAIIVYLHFMGFFLIFGGIFTLISKISGKEFQVNWQGWLAILASVVCLTTAYYLCHNVWKTEYKLNTDKHIGTIRIAMFADSHISTTFDGEGFAEHIETIKAQSPDIVLIPGDFVDDWSKRKDMIRACEALSSIDAPYGVWLVYGNHDQGFFSSRDFTAEELEMELKNNNVHILEDEVAYIGELCIVGRRDVTLGERKDISELLDGVDTDKYIIVLDHEPTDYENEADTAADLVLLGHTHGGQLFPINRAGEWFGINDRTYGYENRNGTDFIVTSGISDWAMDFKMGTKSEYVMIELKGKGVAQNMTEEQAVLDTYDRFQQAMIDKDIDTLNALVTEDIVFTHMSGKQQTKEEFFGEIADGTLNYYSSELHDPVVTVEGDNATLTGSTTLKAKVYGASGTWTLPTNAHFVKINGNWICTN